MLDHEWLLEEDQVLKDGMTLDNYLEEQQDTEPQYSDEDHSLWMKAQRGS